MNIPQGNSINFSDNFPGFIREDLISIKKEAGPYLYLFVQLVYFSGLVRQFGTDTFLLFNIIFTFLLCLIGNRISNKSIRLILISWAVFILMNLISSFVYGLNLQLLAGYVGRITLGYLIVIFLKDSFYEKFERIVTLLALISILFFVIQIIKPSFFYLFDFISNNVLSESRLNSQRSIIGHKYLFVFLLNGWGVLRNSGFMWEPAAFGAVLIWVILLNVLRNNLKLSGRFFLLFGTALTTFSVGTYVSLIAILSILLLRSNRKVFLEILFFLIVIIFFAMQSDLVLKNYDMMSSKIRSEEDIRYQVMSGKASETEISRVAAVEISLKYFLDWPFGYGLGYERTSDLKYLGTSPNGLMRILVTWGIFGIIIILISIKRLISALLKRYAGKLSFFQSFVLLIIFILPLNGNPFYNQPLLFSLILGIWIVNSKREVMMEATNI